jgi:tRNA 2-thiouridine synthesizing protein B
VILHTLNASPASAVFSDCVRVVAAGDAVILLGDGVYVAMHGTRGIAELLATEAELYLLSPDAQAAGVINPAEGITSIDMFGFVTLTERFPRHMAWY